MKTIWKSVNRCQALKQQGLSQADIAKRLRVSRAEVSHLLRFDQLHPKVKSLLETYPVTAAHLRHLVTVKHTYQQIQLVKLTAKHNWSSRDLADEILLLQESDAIEWETTPDKALSQQLTLLTGCSTVVKRDKRTKKGDGYVLLSFSNEEELAVIMDKLMRT